MTKDPFRPVDREARDLAQRLVREARVGALGVLQDEVPVVSRVALAPMEGALVTLVSDLAPHTAALRAGGEASLLIGEDGRGDPLAYPRITLQILPSFLEKSEERVAAYLQAQPKAQLYVGFADFHLVRLAPAYAMLNGGFGKAYRLSADDLGGTGP